MASRFVALVRGINLGRARRVAMADLRSLVAGLGGRDVRTLLNSGNVVWSGPRQAPGSLAKAIEAGLERRCGVKARVQVLTAEDFEDVVRENALAPVAGDPARFLVNFCGDASRMPQLQELTRRDWSPEALAVGRLAAYLWCADGILASRLLEAVGRVAGESMTARNWATVAKIHQALRDPAGGSPSPRARRPAGTRGRGPTRRNEP